MTDHTTGTRDEWLAAREQLLVREKEHTRLGDELAQQRRELPWVCGWKRSIASTRTTARSRSPSCSTDDPNCWSTTSCSARATKSAARSTRRSPSGTDVAGYLTESPGFSAFVLEGGSVYHAYSTTWRGLEFLMSYYPILDHAPKGRDEGEAWQLWIRRHDEYDGK